MSDPAAPASAPASTKTGVRNVTAVLAAAAIVAPLTLASEGLVTRTAADPVGIPTACWGHAGAEAGKAYSLDQCEQVAVLDLAKAGAGIAPCIKVPVADKTRAAFTDFAFNAGVGAFCNSTMAKRLNGGDAPGACAELSKWVFAGGKPLPGLVTRRAAERALCEAGAAETPAAVAPPPVATAPAVVAANPLPPAAPPAAKPSILTQLKEWLS